MSKIHNLCLPASLLAFLACLAGCEGVLEADDAEARRSSERSAAHGTAMPPHEALAEALAAALVDEEARLTVLEAFLASPHFEGKIHFTRFLESQEGRSLRSQLIARLGSEEVLARLLASITPLEMYIPFAAQRAGGNGESAWNGEEGVVVATLLNDEDAPIGFTSRGEREVLDPELEPAITTISLVPAESFDRFGDLVAGPMRPPTAITVKQTGLWVDYVNSPTSEPAYKGAPEMMLVVFNSETKKKVICASENSVKPFAWNMDTTIYTKPFVAATPGQMLQGKTYTLALFEDDGDLCAVNTIKDWIGSTAVMAQASNKGKAASIMAPGPMWLAAWSSADKYEYVFREADADPDDFIGLLVYNGTITGTPAAYQMMDTNLSIAAQFVMSWSTRDVTLP